MNFVDVLLFSFQGSFRWSLSRQQLLYLSKSRLSCQQKVLLFLFLFAACFGDFINIPSFEIKVNNYFEIFFFASEGQVLIYNLLIYKSRGFLLKSLNIFLKSTTNSTIPAITMIPPMI